jgi:hypothetical protein
MSDFYLSYTGEQVQETLDSVVGFQSDYEYQTPVIVGNEIRLAKLTDTKILKFRLSVNKTGGAITISTDNGVTSIALKNGLGEGVTELSAGLVEVAYVAPFFILRSGGGLNYFFGDGSIGVIPNLNLVTTAPNGGTVSALWDMNAGTMFTSTNLSSSSNTVILEIDFGQPFLIDGQFRLFNCSISVGATRTLSFQHSTDGLTWNVASTRTVSTSNSTIELHGNYSTARYWRLVMVAGGSTCNFTCSGAILNWMNGDSETTNVCRIIEHSNPDSAVVVKQYTSYSLPIGYTHTVRYRNQGLVIYSQSNVTNHGVIDLSKKAGVFPSGNVVPMIINEFKSTIEGGIKSFNELTTSLLLLKGGGGGNGGFGGGYSGATGRQTSVGIGGAGRQNLGGFGGGGSGGNGTNNIGGIGGNVFPSEAGGGKLEAILSRSTATVSSLGINGINGSGAFGALNINVSSSSGSIGMCVGGGSGGTGGTNTGSGNSTLDSEPSGGFVAVVCKGDFLNNGFIIADGGKGSDGSSGVGNQTGGGGGGGGSGGGVIAIFHKGNYTNTGTIRASGGVGGSGGSGVSTGEAGGTGSSGYTGRIHIKQL